MSVKFYQEVMFDDATIVCVLLLGSEIINLCMVLATSRTDFNKLTKSFEILTAFFW
jgi:hypothetical protein